VLKIQFRVRPLILQGDWIQKNISVWAINNSLRVIAVAEKRRVAIYPFSKELRVNFFASNSI
jgi:hypothetical protein